MSQAQNPLVETEEKEEQKEHTSATSVPSSNNFQNNINNSIILLTNGNGQQKCEPEFKVLEHLNLGKFVQEAKLDNPLTHNV